MNFVESLQFDIANYKYSPILIESVDLPVDAFLGTLVLKSPLGTVLECYSYIDPDYKPDKYIYVERGYSQKIIQVEFKQLARQDKIYFKSWNDFTIFDTEIFHTFVSRLLQNGFKLFTIKPF